METTTLSLTRPGKTPFPPSRLTVPKIPPAGSAERLAPQTISEALRALRPRARAARGKSTSGAPAPPDASVCPVHQVRRAAHDSLGNIRFAMRKHDIPSRKRQSEVRAS